MSKREKTAFDLDFDTNMKDPEFRASYTRARARIDAIDELVRTLDAERAAQGMPKAELARRMGVHAEAIRRLFSSDRPNPTMKTVVAAAEVLGLKVQAVPAAPKRGGRGSRRRSTGAAMELYTVGYEGRTLPQFVRLLREHGITRLVDVRERPASRKPGFSASPLFEALRKVGITYESDRALGNPEGIRELWKNGSLTEGKVGYRKLLRNGRRARVEVLLTLASSDRVCILCFESDPDLCHRTIIAEEAARPEPGLSVHQL